MISSPTTHNTTIQSPSKRLSRSRHSYDATIYHEKQRQKRPITSKFDAMSCFNEVSRLVGFLFFVGLFIQANDT